MSAAENTQERIQSTKLALDDDIRIAALVKHFGQSHHASVPSYLFHTMKGLAPSTYNGGTWEFHELSNGGFFMSPDSPQRIEVHGNGYQGDMSAEASGITVCLFGFCAIAAQLDDEDEIEQFASLYHNLRDYAVGHAEANAILSAID